MRLVELEAGGLNWKTVSGDATSDRLDHRRRGDLYWAILITHAEYEIFDAIWEGHLPLKVIGTGFGRTGTESMREALTMIGFGPCHHMREIFMNPEQKRLWRAVAAGAAPDWSRMFDGYHSCVDWPSAFYWRELIEAYPNAKVLLTYRSPESWWASFEKTLLVVIKGTTERESLDIALVAEQVFGGRPDDRAHAVAVYREYVEAVLATVPPGRLLVHRLGDGWPPLCAHLGVEHPTDPYPCRNTGDEFRAVLDHIAAQRAESQTSPSQREG